MIRQRLQQLFVILSKSGQLITFNHQNVVDYLINNDWHGNFGLRFGVRRNVINVLTDVRNVAGLPGFQHAPGDAAPFAQLGAEGLLFHQRQVHAIEWLCCGGNGYFVVFGQMLHNAGVIGFGESTQNFFDEIAKDQVQSDAGANDRRDVGHNLQSILASLCFRVQFSAQDSQGGQLGKKL